MKKKENLDKQVRIMERVSVGISIALGITVLVLGYIQFHYGLI